MSNLPQGRKKRNHKKKGFLHRHSLGLASLGILVLLIILYNFNDPQTHWGSFLGNAVADWTGVAVTVFATKYLYEKGSAESRNPKHEPDNAFLRFCLDHSLLLVLIPTGVIWTVMFLHSKTDSKWGQVVGNVVSEWTKLIGLVIMTKRLIEQHSKESAKG